MNEHTPHAPGFLRRVAAIFYDLLLLLGILFAVSAGAVALNNGQAVSHPLYYLSLVVVSFLFFGGFWTHGGQTLGMRTWRIKLVQHNGSDIHWQAAAYRFVAAAICLAPLGLGLLWVLFDRQNNALHDYLSKTRLEKIAK